MPIEIARQIAVELDLYDLLRVRSAYQDSLNSSLRGEVDILKRQNELRAAMMINMGEINKELKGQVASWEQLEYRRKKQAWIWWAAIGGAFVGGVLVGR